MKMKRMLVVVIMVMGVLFVSESVLAAEDSTVYKVDPVKESTEYSIGIQSTFNYEARFSHLIYSSGTLAAANGKTIVLNGYQEATNPDYPTTRINYRFVKSDGNKNPDDDVVMTSGVTYTGSGYINNREFLVNNGGNAKLRLWNYENYSGSNKNYTVYADGSFRLK